MSGSTPGISREKGGVQVREMMESSEIGVAVRESTAGRRPTIWRIMNLAIAKLFLRITVEYCTLHVGMRARVTSCHH